MNKFFKKKLQRQIMAALISITVIPIGILGAIFYFYSMDTAERKFNEDTDRYLKQISNNLDDNLHHMDMISLMVYTDKSIREILKKDMLETPFREPNRYSVMQQFLTNMNIITKDILGIYIFSDKDIYYQYLYGVGVDNDYEFRFKEDEWYKQAIQKEGDIFLKGSHKPFTRQNSSELVFSMSRAIIDPQYLELLGVIMLEVDIRFIGQITGDGEQRGNGWVVITDENGDIVYSPKRSELSPKIDIDISLLENLSGSYSIRTGKGILRMDYITSKYSGWKVIHFIPRNDIYSAAGFLGIFMLITVIIFIILLIFISFFISSSISKPIAGLNKILQNIGHGEFNKKTNILRIDEIGQLARGIDDMALNLKELVRRVSLAQYRQREAEIKALQSQINPHFLYNTLTSIQMMAKISGQENIAQMADDLGMLFKMTQNKGCDLVTLRNEFNHAERYLKLQQIRYGEKIKYLINADASVMDFYTIKLILQPIVENSIYHGLEPKKTSGIIKISVKTEKDIITICVEDDGVGINLKELEKLKRILDGKETYSSDMMSIGMINVHERLKLNFGEQFGLKLNSVYGEGTSVTIRIPMIPEKK